MALAKVPVTLFTVVMGLCGFTLALRAGETAAGLTHLLSGAAHALTLAVFAMVTLAYLAKAVRHPEAVAEEWRHPVSLAFFPAISISLVLFSLVMLEVLPGAARALFLVAVLDQPARGFRLAEQIGSKQLAEQVELASKQPTELTADQTAALAMAFDQLADDVDRAYRAVLLQRAWNHHRLFTRLHEFEDIYIARSNIAMARLERPLAPLIATRVPVGRVPG